MVPCCSLSLFSGDKVAQYHSFSDWMPSTVYSHEIDEARESASAAGYPVVSKSCNGAGASNVRYIADLAAAHKEIDLVFSEKGMTCYNEAIQQGYVLWQEWIPGLEVNWRVLVLDKKWVIVTKRWNEEGKEFVNDSGKIETLWEMTDEARPFVDKAIEFVKAKDFDWAAVDLIRHPDQGVILILEISCGWPMWWMKEGMMFEVEGEEIRPYEPARGVLRHVVKEILVKSPVEAGSGS